MKITSIMHPNSNHGNHSELLPDFLDTTFWPREKAIDKNAIYDVINDQGKKLGEVFGDQLDFFINSSDVFNPYTLIDSVREGIVVVNASGRICFANETYSHIIGVPLWMILGKDMHIIEPDALLLEVLKTGQPMKCANKLIKSVNVRVSMRMFPICREGKVFGAYSIFRDVTEIHQLNNEVERITGIAEEYIAQLKSRDELDNLQVITRDTVYMSQLQRAVIAARTDAPILIRGENGVGKEVFTRFIHSNSTRKDKRFVAVNCAAIPESLIESELFGYEEGAFTGAKKKGKIGKFQMADGGTLFLDEIGDMPLIMQAKLLRALQEGEIEKVGGESSIKVNVRVITATNQPLENLIQKKLFREDLYYRLNVLSFRIPALRERKMDIPLLADLFLQRFNKKYAKDIVISEETYEALCNYDWPGNVRELQNSIEAAVIMCSSHLLSPDKLMLWPKSTINNDNVATDEFIGAFSTLREETEQFERKLIEKALKFYAGDREAVMQHLGISKRTFYRKTQCQY